MGGKKTVLIVEDDAHIAKAEKLILEHEFDVTIARDGEEGVDLARKIKPAIILLDVMMPKKSGFDVCRELRKDPAFAGTKIVMVTAKDQQIDEMHGMDLGADDYIMKPFEPAELRHVVHQVLKGTQE